MPLALLHTATKSITRHRNEGNLQEYAEQSRNSNRFNDVYIEAGNKTLPAHRLVLACYSQFFERLFQIPRDCELGQHEGVVNLNKLDGEAVKLLVEYMYVGSITISQGNVFNLLATAKFLQMDEVCQFCFDFLEAIISIENWSTILSTLCLSENDSDLKQLYQFISKNFDNIAKSENFQSLKFQDLKFLVRNLNRKIVKRTSIYDAVSSWIRHDESNRKSGIKDLLSLIDLHQLPCDFLGNVVATDPLVKGNVECINAVTSAMTKQFEVIKLRKWEPKLVVVGGIENPNQLTEIRNYYGSSYSVYPDLPFPAYYSKSLELNGYIYSIGGSFDLESSENTEIISNVYRIKVDDSEMKWEEVCPMNEGRYMMGAAVFKDCLVVAGGAKTHKESSIKEEVYIPALNKWQQISKLNQHRMTSELVSCDSCLFALGGFEMEQPLSSMEKLSDLDGEWEVVESMNEPRVAFAAVNCEGEIYAIGGMSKSDHSQREESAGDDDTKGDQKVDHYNDKENSCNDKKNDENGEKSESSLLSSSSSSIVSDDDADDVVFKSVEKYNPVEKKWSFVSDMIADRFGHAACVISGRIFVVGGMDANKQTVGLIESYNPKTNKWTVVGEAEDELMFHSLLAL